MTRSNGDHSRRAFLRNAGIAAAAMLVKPVGAAANPVTVPRGILFDPYARATWERFEATAIRIHAPGGIVDATVGSTVGHAPASAAGECFTVTFLAPGHADIPEGMYRMTHTVIGSFEMFIAPSTSTKSVRRYAALINRI